MAYVSAQLTPANLKLLCDAKCYAHWWQMEKEWLMWQYCTLSQAGNAAISNLTRKSGISGRWRIIPNLWIKLLKYVLENVLFVWVVISFEIFGTMMNWGIFYLKLSVQSLHWNTSRFFITDIIICFLIVLSEIRFNHTLQKISRIIIFVII